MKMPKVWEILRKFKGKCECRGWKTSESEDWVGVGDEYHNFLLTRNIHPSSFKSIASNRKCVIREGSSYRVVEASYTAWLFSESPSEVFVKTIFENPDFCKRIALYDLSPLLEGKNLCFKFNHTDSLVFQEFENFLKNELNVKIKKIPTSQLTGESVTVAEVA
jgi:ABC-type microcin C transport system duplicated ATPase subunit YejF